MPRHAPPHTLGELAARAGGHVEGDAAVRVTGLTHDSRRVAPGDLFAAIPGFERDGHAFVPEAAAAGAAAVLVERPGPWPLPALVVHDVREALGPAAHALWGDPTSRLVVAGITSGAAFAERFASTRTSGGISGSITSARRATEAPSVGAPPFCVPGAWSVRLNNSTSPTNVRTNAAATEQATNMLAWRWRS